MLRTGWDWATLRRQPAPVVEGLIWRLWAEHVWRPDLVELAAAPPPPISDLAARLARADALDYLARLRRALLLTDDG
jgi:hypothetical protein